MNSDIRKWLAFGTGVAIEIGARDLRAVVVRVRPAGIELVGDLLIRDFASRPAAEWGSEYNSFVRKCGASHLAAWVLLPRPDVIVRQLALPGVSSKDMPAAIGYQTDSLHPYPEEDVVSAWAPVAGDGNVLVGIARREVIERYASLFAEAGIKTASFTFSAAVVYSAVRLLGAPRAGGFLALHSEGESLEAYGESDARPIFSAAFDVPAPAFEERARSLALAELRLPEETEPVGLSDILPRPRRQPEDYQLAPSALAYAGAVASACPRLAIRANLLPAPLRAFNSRTMYVPTAALGTLVLLGAAGLFGYTRYQEAQYRAALQAEIRKLEPRARRALEMDKAIDTARGHSLLLDGFRKGTRADLDALHELTQILTPPTWVSSMELTRDSLRISGETEQAAALVKTLDQSKSFRGSEFSMPIAKAARGETFGIRARRTGGGQ